MLDIYKYEYGEVPTIVLYHGHWLVCSWQNVYLKDILIEIKEWLLRNPDEVITVQFENRVNDAELVSRTFFEAGIEDMIFDPVASDWGDVLQNGWPTLEWLLEHNKKFVFFAENKGDGIPYAWDYAIETVYGGDSLTGNNDERAESLNVPLSRNRSLFTVNAFPTFWLWDWTHYERVNNYKNLLARATLCENTARMDNGCLTVVGHLPNFLAVDFVTIGKNGGPAKTVSEINRLWEIVASEN